MFLKRKTYIRMCAFCVTFHPLTAQKKLSQVHSLTSSKMTGALGRCSRNEKRFFRVLPPALPCDFPCLKSRTAGGRKNPNQVQCRTLVGIIWKEDFFRCTKLLLRSASCSPRCSSPCCFRHRRRTGMNLTKYVL